LPPQDTPGTVQDMDLKLPFTSAVAGVSFHTDAVSKVRIGMRADISHDPANQYDANACAVRVGGELVGHLPKAISARLRARGESAWKGVVSEVITGDKATGLRIRVLSSDISTRPSEVEVRARSGRILGILLEQRDGSVSVRTADGSRIDYPIELVAPLSV
jgi:hypothetical protein